MGLCCMIGFITKVVLYLLALAVSGFGLFLLLLKCSKSVQQKWFSYMFLNYIVPNLRPIIAPFKDMIFKDLDKVVSKDAELQKKEQFRLLEIGVGDGANLNWYPKNALLTSLEPNESFKEYYEENRKSHPNLLVEKFVNGVAEDMKEIPDETVDVVVCTHVLCSCTDVDLVLKEVKRVLCKGGQFIFFEHIVAPNDTMLFKIQHVVDPIWTVIFAGCHVTCNTEANLRNAGFSTFEAKTAVIPKLSPLFARHVFGKVIK